MPAQLPSTGVSRASLYQHTIRGSKPGCLSGSNLERSQFYYKHVGCLSGVSKVFNEKYEKKDRPQWFFVHGNGRPWFANHFPIAFPCFLQTAVSHASWEKTDARDLPPWRLNKLRATNFNRNSDYAEVTKTCVRTIISLYSGTTLG